jgi:hypothetical protein
MFKGRQWYFCTKCGCQGCWVCTHSHQSPTNRDQGQYDPNKRANNDNYPYQYRSSSSLFLYCHDRNRDSLFCSPVRSWS